ncbi:BQ5605_C017g08377 [Microbotryum silenes-dioicae]|uniref:BQ5605_C017g08377 protein n=1 Tax=Microbotryum silenes-dioicae TaxID=796604 RepID=A0A2X0LUI5_9BASI|nr:BQ5605_C017g08377 [Microbotryum silenes-dioicae]
MSKYEDRLVLSNFSKLLYKLYNAQTIFCATRTKHQQAKSAPSATANEPVQNEMNSNRISSLFIICHLMD